MFGRSGIYAIAALAAAVFIDRPGVVWVGPALLLATLWQAIVYRWPGALGLELPRVTALFVHATLMVLGAAALVWFRRRGHANLRTALRRGRRFRRRGGGAAGRRDCPIASTEFAGDLPGVARGGVAGAGAA